MMEICGDNRFEIIARAKADLLEGTNIETDEAEMAVIDNILFRCWQMGWLDRYDRKTENSSEIPNNCEEPQYEMGMGTLKCDNCSEYGSFKCAKCDGEMYFKRLEPKDEPQTEEHCETCRHKDECEGATYEYKNTEWWCLAYAPIDEPQTDCDHKCIQTEIGCEKTDCPWK